MSFEANRSALRALFMERAVRTGDFTLASGKKSTYYIDAKQVLYSAQAAFHIGQVLRDRIGGQGALDLVDAVGGLETGAIPMATSLLPYGRDQPLEGFYVRREAKLHGSQRRVEGRLQSGDRAVVLDDVLTTGTSALTAVNAVRDVGAKVDVCVCLVDRLQGAAELLAAAGVELRSVFTVRDFGILPDDGPPPATLESIVCYALHADAPSTPWVDLAYLYAADREAFYRLCLEGLKTPDVRLKALADLAKQVHKAVRSTYTIHHRPGSEDAWLQPYAGQIHVPAAMLPQIKTFLAEIDGKGCAEPGDPRPGGGPGRPVGKAEAAFKLGKPTTDNGSCA